MADTNYKRYRCGFCTLEFESAKEKRYCSKKCNKAYIRKNGSVPRAEYLAKVRENAVGKFCCEHCGKEAFRNLSGTNKQSGHVNRFCSMQCRVEANAVVRAAKPAPMAKPPTMCACEVCSVVFETRRHRKTCSEVCAKEKARRLSNESNRAKQGSKRVLHLQAVWRGIHARVW